MVQTLEKKRHTLIRYKSFWSKKLDGMAKKRKKEYRIAKELNTADAWSKYKDIHNKSGK